MGKLETNHQVAAGPVAFLVGVDQAIAQLAQGFLSCLAGKQLVRIRAAFVAHGYSLAAPNQLGAALAEVAPAPECQIGRFARLRAIPPLHGKNAEPVPDS